MRSLRAPRRVGAFVAALACLAAGSSLAVPSIEESALSLSDWPEFRGVDHAGVADGADLPTAFDGTTGENVAWKTPIPGLAHSSPVVLGDTIYLSTSVPIDAELPSLSTGDVEAAGSGSVDDGAQYSWRLYAVDKNNGEILWHRVGAQGVPRVQRHPKASHASATPASDGERIVVLFGSEGLFCYDRGGNLLWRKEVGTLDAGYFGQPDIQWGPASSPVIHDDLVIVQNDRQADSVLVAYDLDSGDEVWRVHRDEKPAWSTPTLIRGARPELVLNGANWLTAYDPRTGAELWRLSNGDRQVITPTPIVADDRIIITGGYPTGGNPIHAIRPGGSGDLTPGAGNGDFLAWQTERGSPYTPTPLAYRGILYVIVDNGILSAYELESGERLYRTRLNVGAGYSASPVASDGKLYFLSEDGDVMVVRAGPEYELLAENPMGEILMASPAISERMLIVRGTSHLFGITTGS